MTNRSLLAISLIFGIASPLCAQWAAGPKFSLDRNPAVAWKIKAQADLPPDADSALTQPGFDASGWTDAAVPGTVFGAYVAAGYEKDPNFGDNAYHVDRTRYARPFWYRATFRVPDGFNRGRLLLNFLGVNRDAEVVFNGQRLGEIHGIVQRGRFDITALVKAQQPNVLAVLIQPPQAPISNGASPTYGSSDGWDWMPPVPGMNAGIQDEVFLTTTGEVSIIDPWIRADLPDNSRAALSVHAELENSSDREVNGTLQGVILPGDLRFALPVRVPGHERRTVNLDANGFPELAISNPALWWPNGYGPQNLYSCRLTYVLDSHESDSAKIDFGIRRLAIDTSGNVMKIVINGERIYARGGNWGMPEYMLRCSPEDYALRVRLHRDMNFNIIRNWMGSTTDDAFYSACDRNGIMIWDDFWLNSSGGLPRDLNVFNANVVEKLKRLRNHPSIVLWCGDNEGDPQPPLNDWLAADIKTFDGRYYQPNSHSHALSGSGPWRALAPREYFLNAAPGGWGGEGGWGMRSEIGTAVFVNLESFQRFIPAGSLWPRNQMWDRHFFGPSAENAGPDSYLAMVDRCYGPSTGIAEFCRKAQLLNLAATQAMFEGWTDHLWNDASGLIIWMSQSAFPSCVWQTYDYYFDATGAYWGAKRACEPVHIQWNPVTNGVKVVNTTRSDLRGVRAELKVYGLDGTERPALAQEATLDAPANAATACFVIPPPDGDLARGRPVRVSSVHVPGREGDKMVDGDPATRWESDYADQPWAAVDLGEPRRISRVTLDWDVDRACSYKLQVSNDGTTWRDTASRYDAPGGNEIVDFPAVDARWVRVFCLEKATPYAISLKTLGVFGEPECRLDDVHFLRLRLIDASGALLSENVYWRGVTELDYRRLNQLAPVNLRVATTGAIANGVHRRLTAQISNPADSPAAAFAIHLQVLDPRTGERVLPLLASDNYFTLMRGESRAVTIDYDAPAGMPDQGRLVATPFNAIH